MKNTPGDYYRRCREHYQRAWRDLREARIELLRCQNLPSLHPDRVEATEDVKLCERSVERAANTGD